MQKILLYIFIFSIFNILVGLGHSVYATDFSVEIEKIYTISTPNEVEVVETRKITNNSSNRIISKENQESFQIIIVGNNTDKLQPSLFSAKTFIGNRIVQNNSGLTTENTTDILVPYDGNIEVGGTKEFRITYTNYGLASATGALIDMYAPGFNKDYTFQSDNTRYKYKTVVKINKVLGEIGFMVPVPSREYIEGNYIVYEISQESLVGSKIWLQIGKAQYYSFLLTQDVKASESINKGYSNEYHLIIPRDMSEVETTQSVWFESFDPEPKEIKTDNEGNIIATFKILSNENTKIVVKGYAEVKRSGNQANLSNSGEISQIDSTKFQRYLGEADFWEVTHPEIVQKATTLKAQESNIYKIIENTYTELIDTIDYSEVKRFGINERQGALKTLRGGAAVCMEYSDLFLALSRAQGIPARAAFGYGYDSRIGNDSQEAHQWVQVYLPGQNQWLSVDVTWGESGTSMIGGDLNHFYTHVATEDPQTPPSVQRVSFGNNEPLEPPAFEILAIKELPEGVVLASVKDVLEKYPVIEKTQFEAFLDEFGVKIKASQLPTFMIGRGDLVLFIGALFIILSLVLFVKLLSGAISGRQEKSDSVV